MQPIFECGICHSILKTKVTLRQHTKSNKKCLSLREEIRQKEEVVEESGDEGSSEESEGWSEESEESSEESEESEEESDEEGDGKEDVVETISSLSSYVAKLGEVLERFEKVEMNMRTGGNEGNEKNEGKEGIDEGTACIICVNDVARYAAVPCGHTRFCGNCADQMLIRAYAAGNEPKCPCCRVHVSQYMRIIY